MRKFTLELNGAKISINYNEKCFKGDTELNLLQKTQWTHISTVRCPNDRIYSGPGVQRILYFLAEFSHWFPQFRTFSFSTLTASQQSGFFSIRENLVTSPICSSVRPPRTSALPFSFFGDVASSWAASSGAGVLAWVQIIPAHTFYRYNFRVLSACAISVIACGLCPSRTPAPL